MSDFDATTQVGQPPGELGAGQVVGGRYRLERRLGVGGMASVWLATDERLGRRVAVKILARDRWEEGEYRQRFRREAKLAARLQHPNLVGIYDYHAGARPYLVMEYIEGGTLAERVAGEEVPPVERLARELLAALRCIHSAGVLHRDVKPQNVLIDAAGRARLTDFGIAESRDATSITRTGIVIGTETYMAPERRRGEHASERSDLYSLGVLLAEVAARHGAGAGVWELIERLRAVEPGDRPSSASAALADLDRASDLLPGEPTAALPVGAPPGPPGDAEPPTLPAPDRRRQLAVTAIAVALVAVVLGVGLALGGGEEGDGENGGRAGAGTPGETVNSAGREGPQGDGAPPSGSDDAAAVSAPAGPEGEAQAVDGVALDRQGYALIQRGSYEEAIPVLRQAVDALEGSGDELNYNYALFNLARALRLAGHPDEAVPLLQQRLAYPDQQDTVLAELKAAWREAGLEGSGPPPWAEENGDDG